jgi:enterochelin esterase-like enzyme
VTRIEMHPDRDEPLRGRRLDDDRWIEVLATGMPDPTNPSTLVESCTYGNPGPASILELPDALPQPWHARRPDAPRGTMTRHELGAGEHGRPWFSFYTPPGYRSDRTPLPCSVLFDGGSWRVLDVAATFDNLIADDIIEPIVAVLVESIRAAARPAAYAALPIRPSSCRSCSRS